jgi:hypothetical protein
VARQTPHFNLNMDLYEDFVNAIREEEEVERMTAKSKSKTRHKTGKRPKLEVESKKISVRKELIRKLRDFERNDLRHLKRTVAARLGDESSTKVRKAFSTLRQSLSQI